MFSRATLKPIRTVAATVAMASLSLAGPSHAATGLGENFTPATNCPTNSTFLQSASPASIYAAPFSGVITSWSHLASAIPPASLELKVARHAGGNSFTIVGESSTQVTTPSVLNSFATRVPVQTGDVLGLFMVTGGDCGANTGGGYGTHAAIAGDLQPGTTSVYAGPGAAKIAVSATLEPDADNDGFGDETQDECPTDDTAQGACPVPDTTITKQPKDKTKKKRATFEFTSPIAGATFECKLDAAAFAPCTSPHQITVKKGKHSLEVRAIAKGLTDPSPAIDSWKVKKKK